MECELGQIPLDLPFMIVHNCKPKERIKSANYRMSICKKICRVSYRASHEFYNDDYHRTGTSSEIPFSTMVNDFKLEGNKLRETKKTLISGVLLSTPFDPITGILTGNHLPESYKPEPLKLMVVKYEEAMKGEKPLWERIKEPAKQVQISEEDILNDDVDINEINDELLPYIFSPEEESELEQSDDAEFTDSLKVTPSRPEKDPHQFIKDWLNSDASKHYSMPDLHEILPEQTSRTRKKPVQTSLENKKEQALAYVNYVNTTMATIPGLGIPRDWTLELNASDICAISIDVVYVPLQKRKSSQEQETKENDTEEYLETDFGNGKKNVGHVDIKIEFEDYQYNVTAPNVRDACSELMAVIFVNKLYKHQMYVFTDGEEKLIKRLEKYIGAWKPPIILDWSHLAHKCYEKLSLIIQAQRVVDPRGKHEPYESGPNEGEIKKWIMTSLSRLYARQMVRILWFGNVQEAISYLKNIDPDHIKSKAELYRLINYLERKKDWIPCYALRRICGLKNASSSVESENEAVVSNRQKAGGDHWSEEGSSNNAGLKAVFINHEENNWFYNGYLTFKMFNPAEYKR